ncbi:hypothetical protein [Streptococcus suis]|uniref:hypothetical protein n=1 Tax=Streptococcus suis TaxID=1307 RepID=UPI00192D55D3|nr:hypothetical protein [Streptococcus suis]
MKKKKNFKLYFGIFCVLAFFGWVMQLLGLAPKTETPTVPSVTVETSSSSKEEKTEQSSTTETSSSTQEIKNDGPDYTDESNALFANHLETGLNNQLGESGYQVKVQPVGNNVIYIYVPQELKYNSNAEIQQTADALYSIKKNTFTDWAIDNGYDLGFTSSPSLYIKSVDDTTLAEEDMLSNSMKVLVNN